MSGALGASGDCSSRKPVQPDAAAQFRETLSRAWKVLKRKPRCCQAYAVHNIDLQVSVHSVQVQCSKIHNSSEGMQLSGQSEIEQRGGGPGLRPVVHVWLYKAGSRAFGSTRALCMIQVRLRRTGTASADPAVDGGSLFHLVAPAPARLLHGVLHSLDDCRGVGVLGFSEFGSAEVKSCDWPASEPLGCTKMYHAVDHLSLRCHHAQHLPHALQPPRGASTRRDFRGFSSKSG